MKLTFKQIYNGSPVDLEQELGLQRGDIQQIETTNRTITITVKDGVDAEVFDGLFNPQAKIKKLETELADLKSRTAALEIKAK